MHVLLSTIGSRGEVQPISALALALRALGQDVRVCAPPDFREGLRALGIPFVPIGPELRSTAKASGALAQAMRSPEKRRRLMEESVAAQFATVAAAARGCDVLLAGGALQFAAHSIAEHMGIRYVYASYCPMTLPSPHHAPPVFGTLAPAAADPGADHAALWAQDAQRWNAMFGPLLDAERATLGLPPLTDVRGHVFTDHPWLAADATLGPWPGAPDIEVFQTGAWLVADTRPLAPELEAFLAAGEPPVYLGFGSVRAPDDLAHATIQAARDLGRRVIVARGWAELAPVDDAGDCMAVDEVNQQALFPRVAAAVHHGGAGTTTAAARAGVAQVLVPQMYDQPYWARRVAQLGIGCAHAAAPPTRESLAAALAVALEPAVAARARSVAAAVRTDGARIAAERLIAEVAGPPR